MIFMDIVAVLIIGLAIWGVCFNEGKIVIYSIVWSVAMLSSHFLAVYYDFSFCIVQAVSILIYGLITLYELIKQKKHDFTDLFFFTSVALFVVTGFSGGKL